MIKPACNPGSRVRYRANIKLSKEQDEELNISSSIVSETTSLHGALTAKSKNKRKLTVVDYIARKFTDAGYVLFPAVLDAA
ncbi:hypothetical protein [Nostoc sp.]|uniref:hypothetical protein n=1 Tax=Nostoc sp. TaxID=1180 RepID=UPI002FFAFF85